MDLNKILGALFNLEKTGNDNAILIRTYGQIKYINKERMCIGPYLIGPNVHMYPYKQNNS